ncbi:hypothetical protein Poli38472_013390 [Pythium oligandrum]|uniref:Uncharacterized protein n=1 Tax=Pythium oligandrum TaxID=41045 RepID=A0A8K1FD45_PYTOL|nr:hypothetical protein Poli38472_013390 [Pythium oligandrum]|eukprot:TMW57916.1 hypothetical protein Poli38472_013390 [Pythium oligandrum]
MMRDICARFKYSEQDEAMTSTAVATPTNASATRASALDTAQAAASQEPALPLENAAVEAKAESPDEPSTPRTPLPLPTPTPVDCPPRELIHKSLRRYHRDMESGSADLATVEKRIQDDLAPYSVLKLGGFSLGNVAPKLLGAVLINSDKLRTLDLGFNRITDRGATILAQALEQNASLESLYLSGNDIGATGAAAIATALTKNHTLQSLHLSGNNIGEDGAKELAEGLKRNTGLRSLYIGTNGIGSKGMQCLAEALQVNRTLEELTLGQNKVGSEGLKHLATAFAAGNVRLTTLEIGKNGIESDGVLALAKALCAASNRLQNLYVDNNPIGDVGASAFGALLAKNAVLRVLDLSYTQMSLLGLRELSMGLSYSSSLLCLLLDGHDWASTQYMKKTNGLTGMSLSAKGANNFAASCIIGAINTNAKSVLFKLTGVDLTLVLGSLPLSASERDALVSQLYRASDPNGGPRRPIDLLARNERVLKFLQTQRLNIANHKRKSVESDERRQQEDKETAEPQAQRQRTTAAPYQQLSVRTDAQSTQPVTPSPPGAAAFSHPSGIPTRPGIVRHPLPRPPSSSAEKRLSIKSPRYESTMEVQVRKVITDLAKLPFNGDEYASLQTYYLGGCTSPKVHEARENFEENNTVREPAPEKATEQVPCPACRSSRLARYPRTMVLKAEMETHPGPDARILTLLRQLHYLTSVFQHVEHAEQKIDAILTSLHGGRQPSPEPRTE